MKNPITSNQNKTIKMSIITSVYNDLPGLVLTGKSVLSQDYPVEWIIIDSDSGAETRKYLNSIKSKKHKIKWVSEKDKGLYDGMNKGFSLSSGEVVLFLNAADQLSESSTITKVVNSLVEDEWNWCVGLAVRINANSEPQSVWEYFKPSIGGLALGTRTFCHQATFYKREIIERVMPYDITNLAADHLINVRIFKIAKPKMLTFVTCYFMDGGISSQRPLRAAFKDLRKIRIQENLLLMNSKNLDLLLTLVTILLIKSGSIIWNVLRRFSHSLVREVPRLLHETNYHQKNVDKTKRS